MQPEALDVADVELVLRQVGADQLGHHRADVLEHLAAFLDEQLVLGADALFRGAVEEAEIVADVVGELGQQLGAEDVPLMLRGGLVGTLDDHRSGGVAEDEVAVAVAEVQVAGADFRVDHQHRAGLAGGHGVDRGLDTEGGGGTRHVHVVAPAVDTEGGLHFDGDGRVGALQVGAGDDHAVDVGHAAAGTLEGFPGGAHGHLAEDAPLVVGTLGDARHHALRVEDAVLVDDEAALDAGSLLDEGAAGLTQRLDLAALDGGGIVGIELLNIGIEGSHQLVVGDAVGGGIQASATDYGFVHGTFLFFCGRPERLACRRHHGNGRWREFGCSAGPNQAVARGAAKRGVCHSRALRRCRGEAAPTGGTPLDDREMHDQAGKTQEI